MIMWIAIRSHDHDTRLVHEWITIGSLVANHLDYGMAAIQSSTRLDRNGAIESLDPTVNLAN